MEQRYVHWVDIFLPLGLAAILAIALVNCGGGRDTQQQALDTGTGPTPPSLDSAIVAYSFSSPPAMKSTTVNELLLAANDPAVIELPPYQIHRPEAALPHRKIQTVFSKGLLEKAMEESQQGKQIEICVDP